MDGLAEYERYKILAPIGTGGMADVFLGVHLGEQQFRQLVVIKRIRPDFLENQQARQMFVDEAMTVASLSHPNIVQIHDLRELDGRLCIAMEYVDGETLSFLLRQLAQMGQRLPLDVACKLMIQASEGLHAAHTATDEAGRPLGLVHRDISPHNLMVDRNGYLKVIDFGIAKSRLQSEKTAPGTVKGKLSYLSPEHFKREVDARSDIYALGLVFFELVTGRKAVEGGDLSLERLMHVVLTRPLPPVSQIVPGVPKALDAVLAKATAKRRQDRYPDAEAFAADIRAVGYRHDGVATHAGVQAWLQATFESCLEERRVLARKLLSKTEAQVVQPSSVPSVASPPKTAALEARVREIEQEHRLTKRLGWAVALLAIGLGPGLWLGSLTREPRLPPGVSAPPRAPATPAEAHAGAFHGPPAPAAPAVAAPAARMTSTLAP